MGGSEHIKFGIEVPPRVTPRLTLVNVFHELNRATTAAPENPYDIKVAASK